MQSQYGTNFGLSWTKFSERWSCSDAVMVGSGTFVVCGLQRSQHFLVWLNACLCDIHENISHSNTPLPTAKPSTSSASSLWTKFGWVYLMKIF
jgi:hypothetical protein